MWFRSSFKGRGKTCTRQGLARLGDLVGGAGGAIVEEETANISAVGNLYAHAVHGSADLKHLIEPWLMDATLINLRRARGHSPQQSRVSSRDGPSDISTQAVEFPPLRA